MLKGYRNWRWYLNFKFILSIVSIGSFQHWIHIMKLHISYLHLIFRIVTTLVINGNSILPKYQYKFIVVTFRAFRMLNQKSRTSCIIYLISCFIILKFIILYSLSCETLKKNNNMEEIVIIAHSFIF